MAVPIVHSNPEGWCGRHANPHTLSKHPLISTFQGTVPLVKRRFTHSQIFDGVMRGELPEDIADRRGL